MRLWTLHPSYLDSRGLVALWRESLLARTVLANKTRGYTNHPQLLRFRESTSPVNYVDRYLDSVFDEATRRGYRFDVSKLVQVEPGLQLTETTGQLEYEWAHLLAKLEKRSPMLTCGYSRSRTPNPIPSSRSFQGPCAPGKSQLGGNLTRNDQLPGDAEIGASLRVVVGLPSEPAMRQ
jgi:Pyrimidine dimer DNA glycosylase